MLTMQDATCCFICFLPTYSSLPITLSHSEYNYLLEGDPHIKKYYRHVDENTLQLRPSGSSDRESAYSIVSRLRDLWIIDDGTGMSADIIERSWMVIGTNEKEQNVISGKGRARTGAKGIGRFALDRLGSHGTVYSTCEACGQAQSIKWHVDWNQFDKEGSILDEIPAELHEDGDSLSDVLKPVRQFSKIGQALKAIPAEDWDTGTAIKIGLLRDDWSRQQVDQLNTTLGALIPPLKQRELSIFLFDADAAESYGRVDPVMLDDYDYKLEASLDGTDSIHFAIYRNELDAAAIDPELFRMGDMRAPPFDDQSFQAKKVSYSRKIVELFPGAAKDFRRKVEEIGPFSTQLLFYKLRSPSRRDSKIYPYRPVRAGNRKKWLDQFGGIKIYRDNFAVRPYGEAESRAFDWLALGHRVAISPVAASRKGWKVSPQNLAGTVSISREANKVLCDQANREGIIENEHFGIFRSIILKIIHEFEDDRSHIHKNLNKLYKRKHKTEAVKSEGAKTAKRIVDQRRTPTVSDAKQLAKAFVAQEDEIRELKDEQSMLRALATVGTVLVSFSHEMGQLQNTMGSRSSALADILSSYISPDEFHDVPSPFNPYVMLQEWEDADKRIKQWFTFVLSSIRANRRRRRRVALKNYLKHASGIWAGFLTPREIELNVTFEDEDQDYQLLAYEIDLDSIFSNLILNSVEALLSSRHHGPRRIEIHVDCAGDLLQIDYSDSGPGLDPSIRNPNHIFSFGVSTKRGPGNESGTGLGMWILNAVTQEYGGKCRILQSQREPGFHLQLTLRGL